MIKVTVSEYRIVLNDKYIFVRPTSNGRASIFTGGNKENTFTFINSKAEMLKDIGALFIKAGQMAEQDVEEVIEK